MDISNVDRIEAIIMENRRLNRELEGLKGRRSCDNKHLQFIYDKAKEMADKRNWSMGVMREYYMFVVLFMYDPIALVKRQKRGGIRSQVAKIMGINSNSVSYVTKSILFHYRVYSDFQNQVKDLYDAVWEKCRLE